MTELKATEKLSEPRVWELVAPGDLKPHPKNYKTHPEAQLAHIRASLVQHGFYRNVVVAKDGTILAGHGVVTASIQLGLEQIPVIRLSIAADSAAAKKILTADNELGRFAESDDRALTEMLKELNSMGDLLGTGFDEKMLSALAMVTRPASEIRDGNAAAEWLGMPEFNAGTKALYLTVNFGSEADRDEFVAKYGLDIARIKKLADGSHWSMWYPAMEKQDLSSVKFEEAGAQ